MSVAIKRQLEESGIKLSIKDDKISAIGVLTDEVCSLIRQHRDALFSLLLQDNDSDDAACFFEPEEKFVAEWRGIIAELSPDNRDEKALLRTAKQFLDGPFVQTAVDSGWGAIELFGLNQNAPRARLDCMGLVPTIAWASWSLSVVSIDETFAQLMNGRTGQVLRQPRQLPGAQWSVPFWEIARA